MEANMQNSGSQGAGDEESTEPVDQLMEPVEHEADALEGHAEQRIADLSYEAKCKALRIFLDNLWANCKPGDYLDAVDTV